jgi:hypothetical protein
MRPAKFLPAIMLVLPILAAPAARAAEPTMKMIARGVDERMRIAVTRDASAAATVSASPGEGVSEPMGGMLEMHLVAQLPASKDVLTTHTGFDLDHDGVREFILTEDGWRMTLFEFFESPADDSYDGVHVLMLQGGSLVSFHAGDAGDADGDGRSELIVFGRIDNAFSNRIYESTTPGGFPTHLVWQIPDDGWTVGARIGDTDGDGVPEIVIAGQTFGNIQRIAIYENTGNNSYTKTFHQGFPAMSVSQSMTLAYDLDLDGHDEVLYGGIGEGGARLYMVESTGNDAYASIWDTVLESDGQLINVEQIVDAGDLDGDGKREFLVGGLRTTDVPPWFTVVRLFETTADNTFEPVADFVQGPVSVTDTTSIAVADVDGDGKREVVLGRSGVKIYRNVGDNAWAEVWSAPAKIRAIGAGDHDKDGKEEVLFQVDGPTTAWEVSAADQADLDGDDVVDAIDNCADAANPDQGPAVLGQTIRASAPDTFSWPTPAAVAYVRGSLAGVATYAYDLFDTLAPTSTIVDARSPLPGEGFYYLAKPSCAVGSWQSSPGAEPGRDALLP